MAREGTRSATGNSKPRVFNTVDTGPTIKRSRKPKTAGLLGGKAGKTETKVAPKKKGPAKQAGSAVAKVKAAVKKTEKKVAGAAKAPKKATT